MREEERMFFSILFSLIVVQRMIELWIAKKNERWMTEKGAYEVGRSHYKYIVILHVMFFVSLLIEVQTLQRDLANWWLIPFVFFLMAQLLRIWSIKSLGRYWNTRIIILPGANVVEKGPYRFMRHPNYVIVITEILTIPLIFQAYLTATLFTLLNALVLSIRISMEERALMEATNYRELFLEKSRFIP
jgi:methyltransferase